MSISCIRIAFAFCLNRNTLSITEHYQILSCKTTLLGLNRLFKCIQKTLDKRCPMFQYTNKQMRKSSYCELIDADSCYWCCMAPQLAYIHEFTEVPNDTCSIPGPTHYKVVPSRHGYTGDRFSVSIQRLLQCYMLLFDHMHPYIHNLHKYNMQSVINVVCHRINNSSSIYFY